MKLNRSTTGFSLPELLLVLGVASIALAITGSIALQALRAEERDVQIQTTVTMVLNAMEQKVERHWVETQCRTTPTEQRLQDLVSEGYLSNDFKSDWPVNIAYPTQTVSPYILSLIRVSLKLESPEDAQASIYQPGIKERINIEGNTLTVSRYLSPISTQDEHINYNPTTGCMEST